MRHVKIALTDPFRLMLLSLFALIVVAGVLFFTMGKDVAWSVSYAGTVCVLLGSLLYAAWRDPERRYPEDSFGTRLRKIVTFQRR